MTIFLRTLSVSDGPSVSSGPSLTLRVRQLRFFYLEEKKIIFTVYFLHFSARSLRTLWPKIMNRFTSIVVLAALAGGCARSDLGERAVSDAAKAAVKDEAGKVKSSAQKIGDVQIEGGKLVGTDAKGEPLWELSAKLIVTKEQVKSGNPKRATLSDATVKLYRAGQLESTFDAPVIEFFNADKGLRLTMPRGVKASNAGALGKDGVPIQVAAPRGDVDVSARVVNLSGGARVVRGPILVMGQTLRTQTDLARSTLNGAVVATSPDGTTKAKRAIFAWKANKLAANAVTFTRPGLTLTGDNLDADTAAQKGTLSGHVRAVAPDSSANAPSVDFDWKADSIRAANANLTREGAQMQTAQLRTDSKLKVADAQNVTIRKDGAILKAASARGFDGLKQLSGTQVTVTRDGTTLTAARAQADNWSAQNGKLTGSGGVTATDAQGRLRAPTATWSGGPNGQIVASGGVEIVSDGTTIRGARGQSDAKFKVATLNGDVRATLKDGSTLRAPSVRKSGDQIVASGGTLAQMQTSGQLGLLTIRAPRVETTVGGQTARASGGVNLKSASGATATAPTATFDRAAQKVVASGGVTYRDPKIGTLNGKTLRADLRLQSAVMDQGNGQIRGDLFGGKGLFN